MVVEVKAQVQVCRERCLLALTACGTGVSKDVRQLAPTVERVSGV